MPTGHIWNYYHPTRNRIGFGWIISADSQTLVFANHKQLCLLLVDYPEEIVGLPVSFETEQSADGMIQAVNINETWGERLTPQEMLVADGNGEGLRPNEDLLCWAYRQVQQSGGNPGTVSEQEE